MEPKPNQWVLENYNQDPKTGRWVRKPEHDDPLLTYFADTARGTPVVGYAQGGHLPPVPEDYPGNDPRTAPGHRLKRMVFWGFSLRKDTGYDRFAGGLPLYRRAVVFRKDLESKRDLSSWDWLGCAREDDTDRLAEICAKQRERLDRDAAEAEARTKAEAERKATREAEWQAHQAAKLRSDKAKAEGLGLSLEEYLDGLAALRQMRLATRPGSCLICKRHLSLKTSVTRGVGPECYNRLTVAERISAAASVVARVGGAVA